MKWLRRALIGLGALFVGLAIGIAGCALLPAATARLPGENAIAELERVSLGGFEQTVLLRGRDANAPVLLYVHGGPGAGMLPLAPGYSRQLEEHLVVVNWDQRGAGASCEGIDWNTLSLDQVVSDLIELSERLAARPGANGKIFLLGHSWGSVVGTHAVARRPDLYHAYIGLGQVVNGRRNEELSLQWVREEATRRDDAEALAELAALSPPYESREPLMVQRRWLNTYGGSFYAKDRLPSTLRSLLFGREYTLATRSIWFDCLTSTLGELWGVIDTIDFPNQIERLDVPVFFFTGRHDWNTPYPLVEEWARSLDAPRVEMVWFEEAGHMIPLESSAEFERELLARLLPLAAGS